MLSYKSFTFIIIMAMLLTSCSLFGTKQQIPQSTEVKLYFVSSDNTLLREEIRSITKNQKASIVDDVLNELFKGPKSDGILNVIPSGATIKSLKWKTDLQRVELDFSKEFGLVGGNDIIKVYAIAKTLCSIEGVKDVAITVEGAPMADQNGNKLELLTEQKVNEYLEKAQKRYKEVVLYFLNKRLKLQAEKRTIEISDKISIAEAVVNQLIAGPSTKGLIKTIPDKTKLISIYITDKVCSVNLSSEFTSMRKGSETEDAATIYSVVNSLCAADGIEKVSIYVEGNVLKSYGSLDLSNIITKRDDLIN